MVRFSSQANRLPDVAAYTTRARVFEFVVTHGDLPEKEWKRLISRVPVDGKAYNLEEFRAKTGDASTGSEPHRVHNLGLE